MWSILRRAGAGVAVLIAAVVLALNRPTARSVFLITLFSVSLCYVVAPLAEGLRRLCHAQWKPLTSAVAVLVIYLVMLLAGTAASLLVAGTLKLQLTDLDTQIPTFKARGRQRLETVEQMFDRISPSDRLYGHLGAFSRIISASLKTRVISVGEEISASRSVLRWSWLVPAVAMLLITRVPSFRRSAVARLPEGHLRWRGEEFFQQVNCVLAGYIRAQLLSCGIVGMVSVAGFWLIGMPYPMLIGALSGALEFLPIVGPMSAAVVACAIVSGERLLALIGFLVALRFVQDYFIYPRLAGRGMHLHPVAIIIAILAGAETGGMFGVLAAIPIVGVASVAVRHWREYWALEKLVKTHAR